MADDKDHGASAKPESKTHVVETTDASGSVAGRDAFRSEAEAETHAAERRTQGLKAEVSPLTPKAKE